MPVWAAARGRTPGVFDTWRECEASVEGFSQNLYRRFAGRAEATAWLAEHADASSGLGSSSGPDASSAPATAAPIGTQQSEEISEEQRAHLFDRFYRAEGSRSRATGGSGLGLSICKNIAEAHGGSIEAGHSPLGGLSIRVHLPA